MLFCAFAQTLDTKNRTKLTTSYFVYFLFYYFVTLVTHKVVKTIVGSTHNNEMQCIVIYKSYSKALLTFLRPLQDKPITSCWQNRMSVEICAKRLRSRAMAKVTSHIDAILYILRMRIVLTLRAQFKYLYPVL